MAENKNFSGGKTRINGDSDKGKYIANKKPKKTEKNKVM